jgi:hypothetical protein
MFAMIIITTLILSGCSGHSKRTNMQAHSIYSPQEVILSGSPCVDGLIANINNHCEYFLSGLSPYTDQIIITCGNPIEEMSDNSSHEGYTELTFVIIDDLSEINEGTALFCSDHVASVGFIIE